MSRILQQLRRLRDAAATQAQLIIVVARVDDDDEGKGNREPIDHKNAVVNGRVTLYHDLVYPTEGHNFDPVSMIVRDRADHLAYTEGQAGRIAVVTLTARGKRRCCGANLP